MQQWFSDPWRIILSSPQSGFICSKKSKFETFLRWAKGIASKATVNLSGRGLPPRGGGADEAYFSMGVFVDPETFGDSLALLALGLFGALFSAGCFFVFFPVEIESQVLTLSEDEDGDEQEAKEDGVGAERLLFALGFIWEIVLVPWLLVSQCNVVRFRVLSYSWLQHSSAFRALLFVLPLLFYCFFGRMLWMLLTGGTSEMENMGGFVLLVRLFDMIKTDNWVLSSLFQILFQITLQHRRGCACIEWSFYTDQRPPAFLCIK